MRTRRRSRNLAASLALVLAVAGCHAKPALAPDVILRVGDRTLTLTDFKRYIDRNTGTDLGQIKPEAASALLDQYVDEVLLAEYASSHAVDVPAERVASAVRNDPGSTVNEKRDEMRRQLLIASLAADVPPATDDAVKSYYDQHPGDFKTGEEVHVRQILVRDETLASSIVEKLHAGVPFEELSGQYSLAPNAKRGGDIGFVSRGELPLLFEAQIFAVKPGATTGVIHTDSGLHIFKVDERRGPGIVDLQTAGPVIRERLKDETVRERIAQLVAQTRSDMPVTVLTHRLPFAYSGSLPKSANE
jgi:hypothetical protein